jgi:predicted component of type VI protein secretion system
MPSETKVVLTVISERNKGKKLTSTSNYILVGRRNDKADMNLTDDDGAVHGRQFEIRKRGDKYLINNLGHFNKTMVNNKKLDYGELKSGDIVKVGFGTEIQFKIMSD